ncbi:DUF3256 family protein [Parabacteroides sp. PF5-9]|uniref:DUF3256 family protein n=1 Tax=Parabacteroides sp. PF5-9 TaxID=1742404 RepID=UPI002474B64D|nr:DUF3256 family protein [Parabacteroides sp. PF5-9]MDH6358423.1 hypothetical protein [Parabacteroides sp. PF5-9]
MMRFIFTIIGCFFLSAINAQDMASVFTNMPDRYIPQLESAWRRDLIDLYNSSDKEARLQNTMTGYSVLEELTADYLRLRSTERTTIEMKLLPLVNNTYIICMTTTIEGPAADSRISFFTTEWQPLEAETLLTPVNTTWFIQKNAQRSEDEYDYAISRLDMDLIKYQLSPENLTLTATYTTPLYLSREERDKITPFIKDTPKVYTWERSQFQ